MKRTTVLHLCAVSAAAGVLAVHSAFGEDPAAYLTDTAGRGGNAAVQSVVRVVTAKTNSNGTGFLHKSGYVITAAHVVAGAMARDVSVVTPDGRQIAVGSIAADEDADLALLQPLDRPAVETLPVSDGAQFSIGMQVSTWGYPEGYWGLMPLLSVGYLSGVTALKTQNGKPINKWVVNAAFNRGNSGGPLVSVKDGTVIGVVSSKLTPLPPLVESALDALSKQKSGFIYEKVLPGGGKEVITEGQVIAEVLQYYRTQTQLVMGYAVRLGELRAFLKAHGVDP